MSNFRSPFLYSVSLGLGLLSPSLSQGQTASAVPEEGHLETITVKGERIEGTSEQSKGYSVKKSAGATKLDISIKETPQTVNAVTRQAMEDFGLTNARSALAATPGVIVQNQETDRTSYSSRGSEISNFQTDGLGIPFTDYNYQGGDIDTFIYDRVEVIKGANGLNSSLGDPGASVNFIRKRPTANLQTGLGLSYGSWNTSRLEADIAGSLNTSGSIRGRLIGAAQQGDSYLDNYSNKKSIFSGILEFDLTDSTLLTVGHFRQENDPKGNNWGALPLLDQNGNQLSYSRSYNPVPDWAKWDRTTQNSFVELTQALGDSWKLKASYQAIRNEEDALLTYYVGAPDAAGNGVTVYPGQYQVDNKQSILDVNVSGSFPLLGASHETVIGVSRSMNKDEQRESNADSTPSFNWSGWKGQFPKPNFVDSGAARSGADSHQEIDAIYGAARLHLTNDFRLLLGANHTKAKSGGESYGTKLEYDKSKTLPYAGLTCNVTETFTTYTSYSTIFRPQSKLDSTGKLIDPVEGQAYEAGVKGDWLSGRLLGSLALFQTNQKHFPVRASDSPFIKKRYEVADLKTQGYELNVNGKVDEQTNVIFGFTQVRMKDAKSGAQTRTYLPSRFLNLMATHQLKALPSLKLGAGATWQSKIFQDVEGTVYAGTTQTSYSGRIRQADYALLNLMASYEASEGIAVQVNGNNVTNKKYLNSFPDAQGFYGTPAQYTVAVSYKK